MDRYEKFIEEHPHLRSVDFEFFRFYKGTFTYIAEAGSERFTVEVTPEYRTELLPIESLRSLYVEDEDVFDTLNKWEIVHDSRC